MPPFPHLHNTTIYERRNNWSLKSSEGKKTLQHSLPSAAQHASGDLSVLQSPTQGMTQGLSFYYIARHRMLGVMTSNKDDCETIMRRLQSTFQVYLIMDHEYRSMGIQQTTQNVQVCQCENVFIQIDFAGLSDYNNKTQVQQNLPAF